MCDWNNVECGFNANEETLNFGQRNICSTNLYEMTTLAVIRKTEDVSNCMLVEFESN